jgi:EAL domain-containing protein (putative c-di-GMP-specific phosphodiesterase class I)/PAS domain-containing protein
MTDNAHLLIIDQTPERAEKINSQIRNAGINIHTFHARSLADAEQSIQASPPLLVLCAQEAYACLSASELFNLAQRHGLQVAVYCKPAEPGVLLESLAHGSCLALNSEKEGHLVEAIKTLLAKHKLHGELASLRSMRDELDARCSLLLDCSNEATAYLHEGLHVYANPAYLELLQAGELSALETLSLMDIASSQTHDLKKLLRDISHGEHPGTAIEAAMRARDGGSFDAELQFSAARFNGEDCIQIMVRQKGAPASAQIEGEQEDLPQARSAFEVAARDGGRLETWNPPVIETGPESEDPRWKKKIRHALNNNHLYSVQQPIIDLDGESEGLFENVIFMRGDGRDLPGDVFMPHAARVDLGTAIDRHVIPGLLQAISGSDDKHIINLSANSIHDFSFPSWLQHQLHELGVEGSQLILQVSSAAAASNLKACMRLVEEIHSMGCGFSLSEFDDQQLDCEVLNTLRVGWVKMRSGLAPGLATHLAHQEIVRHLVATAHAATVQVIADEVRDAADLAMLWQCGVKLVAGSFFKESSQLAGQ